MSPFYVLHWVLHGLLLNMYAFVFDICLDICAKCMYVRRVLFVIAGCTYEDYEAWIVWACETSWDIWGQEIEVYGILKVFFIR